MEEVLVAREAGPAVVEVVAEPECVSVEEAARRLRVAKNTLYRGLQKNDRVVGVGRIGRRVVLH